MARAQILRYISRPKYTRQSPDCPLVIFSFTALPSRLHCSTSYSSAFAQHCIVARPPLPTSCTRMHPHRFYPSRVSPSDPVSLLQVRPLPTISSESQQVYASVNLQYVACASALHHHASGASPLLSDYKLSLTTWHDASLCILCAATMHFSAACISMPLLHAMTLPCYSSTGPQGSRGGHRCLGCKWS